MAESPAHMFGQFLGNFLEAAIKPELAAFCAARGLYLDSFGPRPPVRTGARVMWGDGEGNAHALDFVVERDGTATRAGRPVAFIEAAWRSYTKHSKAKAQEIQAAVLPVVDALPGERPFYGAVLAGRFTRPAVLQLRSTGFQILEIPAETVIAAFAAFSVDIAFDERTSDADFRRCVERLRALGEADLAAIGRLLVAQSRAAVDRFMESLSLRLDRHIARIVLTPLYGQPFDFAGISELDGFLGGFDAEAPSAGPAFRRFHLTVTFTNGDRIHRTTASMDSVRAFIAHL